jgi:hypothetical protein
MPTIGPGPVPFILLANVYASLANSPRFCGTSPKKRATAWPLAAAGVQSRVGAPLPLLGINGQAPSPEQAARIVTRVSQTLRAYIKQAQTSAGIPPIQRVQVKVLSAPQNPILIQSHWQKGPLIALSIVLGLLLFASLVKFAEERHG